MNYHNQEGHLSDESIAQYVEVLQSEDWEALPDEIQEHIESCITCHQQALDLYAIMSKAASSGHLKAVEKPPKGGRIISRRMMRWAMVAVLAGLSFYFYRYLDRPKPMDNLEADRPIATEPDQRNEAKDLLDQTPTTPIPKKEDTENPPKSTTPAPETNVRALYAANFVPSESMEQLLADQLRSAGLALVQPANEKVQNWRKGITFTWTGSAEEELSLRLEDNRGRILHEDTFTGLKVTLQLDLEPGVYYWRLESEEDLLMLGRLVLE